MYIRNKTHIDRLFSSCKYIHFIHETFVLFTVSGHKITTTAYVTRNSARALALPRADFVNGSTLVGNLRYAFKNYLIDRKRQKCSRQGKYVYYIYETSVYFKASAIGGRPPGPLADTAWPGPRVECARNP